MQVSYNIIRGMSIIIGGSFVGGVAEEKLSGCGRCGGCGGEGVGWVL